VEGTLSVESGVSDSDVAPAGSDMASADSEASNHGDDNDGDGGSVYGSDGGSGGGSDGGKSGGSGDGSDGGSSSGHDSGTDSGTGNAWSEEDGGSQVGVGAGGEHHHHPSPSTSLRGGAAGFLDPIDEMEEGSGGEGSASSDVSDVGSAPAGGDDAAGASPQHGDVDEDEDSNSDSKRGSESASTHSGASGEPDALCDEDVEYLVNVIVNLDQAPLIKHVKGGWFARAHSRVFWIDKEPGGGSVLLMYVVHVCMCGGPRTCGVPWNCWCLWRVAAVL